MTKISMEINNIEPTKTIEKINKIRNWFFENIKFTNLELDSPREKQRT